ncbi:MAG TPA: T9SS type A sorting domain-containing protein, partial [Candidatus Eisenbacteria bacterium]
NFNTHRKFICFRVQPVDSSFDLRDIDLSGITLEFGGTEIPALAGKTHLSLDCDNEGEYEGEGEGEGDCDDCESDSLNCEPQLHACFSMPAIQELFGDASLPSSFVDATVNGTLTTGESFVATIGSKFPGNNGNQANNGNHGEKGMNARIHPNPLNPKADLTFSLSQPGRVRVRVYDLQGRLVKVLLDENRPVGAQTVTWNGSNSQNASVPSGVYFFRIQAPQGEEVQRATVVK